MVKIRNREGVVAEVQRIYDERGEVRATEVERRARRKSSPLHPCFNWDDTSAAYEFRLMQARTLIRTVKVQVEGRQVPLVHVPRIEMDEPEGDSREGTYKPVSLVVRVEDEFTRAWREAVTRLDAAYRAVKEIADEANGVDEAFERAALKSMDDIGRARRRLERAKPG